MSIEPAAGEETFEGPVACAVSPHGDLYVGNLRDSGWGAGTNTGSLVRLRWRGDLPGGIAKVRAARRGFRIFFTRPVDTERALDKVRYSISSFRRISTPAYGGPDVDRRVETIQRIDVSSDNWFVDIELAELREGFVYEFHLQNLGAPRVANPADGGERSFFPAEAYYTMRRKPTK
jgi:hypothetical protein